jgi:glycosyltransferase involved in cell wall biosynthesis
MQNNKIKVVWLCHFANEEMKSYFNTPDLNEFAPWISLLIDLFRNEPRIELHLVLPNIYDNKDINFEKGRIHYHFFKYLPIPFYNKYSRKIHTLSHLSSITDFFWIKRKVKNCIKLINPNIIHLHGAENAFFYSSGILPLINIFPIITTIQGFVRKSSVLDNNTKQRIRIEEQIIKKSSYFGIRQTDEMKSVVQAINPQAVFHFHNYPVGVPKKIKDNIGKNESIDFIFFARVCKDKGIEDLLKAVSIIKKQQPNTTLSVVGGVDTVYMNHLKNMCFELNITENVSFLGFLPTQKDIHEFAYEAKICVLPTYHDILPGTVLESMFLKLPVVAYAVGGLPELNKSDETIKLVELHNIEQLAKKMLELLLNVEKRKLLTDNALKYVDIRFNNTNVVNDIINAYNKILH